MALNIRGFRDFESVRQYMEQIYLYGCYNGPELAQIALHASSDDYSRVLPLLSEMFPDLRTDRQEDRSVSQRIRRTYETSGQNRMADSYMLRSVDPVKFLVPYLLILSGLGNGESSLKALHTKLELVLMRLADSKKDGGDLYQTVKARLNELIRYGYAEKSGHGRYRLCDDPLLKLSSAQLVQLYDYVCFASNITYPRIPGSFLRRTLEREMLRRGLPRQERALFLLRHNSNHNIFDEELVYQLLDAIREHRWVHADGLDYLPVELRPECRLGRWYVLAADRAGAPVIRLISHMRHLSVAEIADEASWTQAQASVTRTFTHSLYSGLPAAAPQQVSVRLMFDGHPYLLEQFEREIRIGTIVREGDELFYRVKINDPMELMPLLRSYAPWLRIQPGDHGMDAAMHRSLLEMQAALRDDVWQQPDRTEPPRKMPPVKSGKGKSASLELLNRFQSREMQFSLELFARMAAQPLLTLEQIRAEAQKYGLTAYAGRLMEILTDAGLAKKQLAQKDTVLQGARRKKTVVYYRIAADGMADVRLPMSEIEQEYLQFILDEQMFPEATLFLSAETRQSIPRRPLDRLASIRRDNPKGAPLPQYPGPEAFRTLMTAIKECRPVRYTYVTKADPDHEIEAVCWPWKLEYSAYDRRWWVIFCDMTDPLHPRSIKSILNHLRNVRFADAPALSPAELDQAMQKAMAALRAPEPVVLRVTDNKNALKRCCLAFENQEFSSCQYIKSTGQIFYRLTFQWYRFDQAEILRQLMYLGPNVTLLEPMGLRQMLLDRVQSALARFDEQADSP